MRSGGWGAKPHIFGEAKNALPKYTKKFEIKDP